MIRGLFLISTTLEKITAAVNHNFEIFYNTKIKNYRYGFLSS